MFIKIKGHRKCAYPYPNEQKASDIEEEKYKEKLF